ncbi:hypothetical protein Tco_0365414 [Tanacetum coccineum]
MVSYPDSGDDRMWRKGYKCFRGGSDALVEVLVVVNILHAKAALNALNVFCKTLLLLARSKHADVLMSRSGPGTPMIVSSPLITQMGGVIGLGALVGKVTVETLCVFQVRVVRGLVFILKRLHDYVVKELEETSQVLQVVNNVDEANSEARRESFHGVVEFLALELLNTNATVKESSTIHSNANLEVVASMDQPQVTKYKPSNASETLQKHDQVLASQRGPYPNSCFISPYIYLAVTVLDTSESSTMSGGAPSAESFFWVFNSIDVFTADSDIKWDARDQMPKDFKAEVLFVDADPLPSIITTSRLSADGNERMGSLLSLKEYIGGNDTVYKALRKEDGITFAVKYR